MNTSLAFETIDGHVSSQNPAHQKLKWASMALQWISVGYATWVLWQILNWWLDAPRLKALLSRHWSRDLSQMQDWQRWCGLGLDLIAWSLLVAAVAFGWKFFRGLGKAGLFTPGSAACLMRCAWLGVACQITTLAFRPLQSYLVTAHLNADLHIYQFQLRSADLLGVILCLALLIFAHVYAWAVEIAQENKGFV